MFNCKVGVLTSFINIIMPNFCTKKLKAHRKLTIKNDQTKVPPLFVICTYVAGI